MFLPGFEAGYPLSMNGFLSVTLRTTRVWIVFTMQGWNAGDVALVL